MVVAVLSKILKSANVRSGLVFGSAGLAFAVANLVLANFLTVEKYALLSLLIAIVMFSSSLGLMGADGIVNRHPLSPDKHLFLRILATAAMVAVGSALAAVTVYEVPVYLAALLCLVIISFAVTQFAAAYFQSRHHFGLSLTCGNSFNFLLLLVALFFVAFDLHSIFVAMFLLAIIQTIFAGMAVLAVISRFRNVVTDYRYSWREALAIVLMSASSSLLVQLERLVTPRLLTLEDLATLGVLLAIVGPPFRLLQITLGYVLLPVLRAADGRSERVSLLVRELVLALLVILLIWVFLWFATPFLQELFLTDDYNLSPQLILAALVAGTAKGLSGIARAGVTAVSSVRAIEVMGVLGWFSVFVSIAFAYYLSAFGLPGVIYGVTVGWVLRLIASAALVHHQLKYDR
jgi:O-antigen/teichoic acid export membrane protein